MPYLLPLNGWPVSASGGVSSLKILTQSIHIRLEIKHTHKARDIENTQG